MPERAYRRMQTDERRKLLLECATELFAGHGGSTPSCATRILAGLGSESARAATRTAVYGWLAFLDGAILTT